MGRPRRSLLASRTGVGLASASKTPAILLDRVGPVGRALLPMDYLLHFRIFDSEGLQVSLSVDGRPKVEAALDLGWRYTRSAQSALRQIEHGTCELDQLKDIGAQLWESLLPEGIRESVEKLRMEQVDGDARLTVRLDLPPELEGLPWEALFDMQRLHFLATHPRGAIVRHPPERVRIPGARLRPAGPLRVLVVIPEGSGLGVAHEWNRIQLALQAAAPALAGGAPARLDGPVTPDRLASKLEEQGWDIVHIIGHGRVEADGSPAIRLNAEDGGETWTPGDAFRLAFETNPPRLVVLNCCLGGAPDPRRSFAGLGPLLLAGGVRAVVAMRYEIEDNAAIAFASAFYTTLAAGPSAGCVDVAVTRGRAALQRNFSRGSPRSFATPLLFLAPGEGRLFDLAVAAPTVAATPVQVAPRAPVIALPSDLVAAVREGRCIPVIGPGLLGQARGASAAIAPRALAAQLAEESRYPQKDDLALGERAGEWIDQLTLQRVCQHYERSTRRARLTSAILGVHRGAAPPAALRAIAGWRVPGAVSTHFDGLLQRAFEEVRMGVLRAVWGVDQAADAGGGEGALLVHLRGSVFAPDSLVLTEQDHDELWDRLGRLSPSVASLVTGALDRSLLFLGVSPRDAWTKRLARQLRPARARNAGPVFFVTPARSSVDEACWEQLSAEWIEADAAVVIEELSIAAGGTA
jgi:hypothetical protein